MELPKRREAVVDHTRLFLQAAQQHQVLRLPGKVSPGRLGRFQGVVELPAFQENVDPSAQEGHVRRVRALRLSEVVERRLGIVLLLRYGRERRMHVRHSLPVGEERLLPGDRRSFLLRNRRHGAFELGARLGDPAHVQKRSTHHVPELPRFAPRLLRRAKGGGGVLGAVEMLDVDHAELSVDVVGGVPDLAKALERQGRLIVLALRHVCVGDGLQRLRVLGVLPQGRG